MTNGARLLEGEQRGIALAAHDRLAPVVSERTQNASGTQQTTS
ncbi:MAG TPA: hypothetical protein VIM30_06685 [Candidatus Limnocylindrales bacterium]